MIPASPVPGRVPKRRWHLDRRLHRRSSSRRCWASYEQAMFTDLDRLLAIPPGGWPCSGMSRWSSASWRRARPARGAGLRRGHRGPGALRGSAPEVVGLHLYRDYGHQHFKQPESGPASPGAERHHRGGRAAGQLRLYRIAAVPAQGELFAPLAELAAGRGLPSSISRSCPMPGGSGAGHHGDQVQLIDARAGNQGGSRAVGHLHPANASMGRARARKIRACPRPAPRHHRYRLQRLLVVHAHGRAAPPGSAICAHRMRHHCTVPSRSGQASAAWWGPAWPGSAVLMVASGCSVPLFFATTSAWQLWVIVLRLAGQVSRPRLRGRAGGGAACVSGKPHRDDERDAMHRAGRRTEMDVTLTRWKRWPERTGQLLRGRRFRLRGTNRAGLRPAEDRRCRAGSLDSG